MRAPVVQIETEWTSVTYSAELWHYPKTRIGVLFIIHCFPAPGCLPDTDGSVDLIYQHKKEYL